MNSPQPNNDNNRKTILILTANPAGTAGLQLGKEIREIDEGLRRANNREQFKLEQKSAVRERDFYQAILDYKPQIIHFSGHGDEVDGIVLEKEADERAFLNADELVNMFKLFTTKMVIECVLLNACYSEVQAKAISQHVNYVIGIKGTIGDKAAIAFSKAFYNALGAGESIKFAYEFGWNVIQAQGIKEHLKPVLLQKEQSEQLVAFKKIINIIEKQKNKKFDVIAISANNYDYFIKVDRIMADHESVAIEVHDSAGGSGANTVCGLSKLGKKTAIVGCVKNDSNGKKIKNSFHEFSVDTKQLFIKNGVSYRSIETGKTLILVEESGKRLIAVTPGINNNLSKILRADNEKELENVVAQVKEAKILHLTSFAGKDERELQLSILERIDKEKIEDLIVSFTPGAIYTTKGLNQLKDILGKIHIMFLYSQQLNNLLKYSKERNEIKIFSEDMDLKKKFDVFVDWMIKEGIKHPIITVIKDYSKDRSNNVYENYIYVVSNTKDDKPFSHKPERFYNPNRTEFSKDTTGAGDALVAGFLYGILERQDIEKCTDFGFIMSREASKELGARSNLPDQSLLKNYLLDRESAEDNRLTEE